MSRFSGPQGRGAMRREREMKKIEAQDRQAAYDRLTASELLQLLDSRPGGSRRERERLAYV